MHLNAKVLLVMKLTAILLTIACLSASAGGYAQRVSLNEKDVPLAKVFKEIRKQTGINFLFSSNELYDAGKVTVVVSNATVEDVLQICLKDKPFTYYIENNTIVVKQKPIAVFQPADAPPPLDIRGRVVNEKGDPVEGLTVKVKGSNKVTVTDANGEFSIVTSDKNAILIFSGINVET